jgi:hypothetical protein
MAGCYAWPALAAQQLIRLVEARTAPLVRRLIAVSGHDRYIALVHRVFAVDKSGSRAERPAGRRRFMARPARAHAAADCHGRAAGESAAPRRPKMR